MKVIEIMGSPHKGKGYTVTDSLPPENLEDIWYI